MNFSHRNLRRAVIAGIALAAGCAFYPVHNRLLLAGCGAGLALGWAACWLLLDGKGKSRLLLLVSPLLAVLPFILPGKRIDPDALRADYVARMRRLDGTRYVWGGESPLGIDCSGLPRRALRDALWAEGWRHANGTAFRRWLSHWWFDASALALRQGHRGQTRPLGITGPLWELDESSLLAGDLAVRGDGGHVVAYLGNHQWIEADPSWGKVHCWVPQPGDGTWFEHMTAHRWADCERGL